MNAFAGTGILTGAHLRSARRHLLLWAAVCAGLVVATARSLAELYPTAQDRLAYAASAGASPAVAAFNGRGYDLTDLGGIVSYEVGFMGLVGLPILAIHLAVRFSRSEEDAGRTELVTAGRVGRLAPLAAAAATVTIWIALVVILTALGLQAVDLPAGGSWRYAISLGFFAAAFAAIGLLAAEVSREARTASMLGLLTVLVTFLVRSVVDGRQLDVAWTGPSGWVAEMRPWGQAQWWPIVAYAALTVVGTLLAGAVAVRRDLAGGLIATRPGPAYGAASLGTPVGMALRLLRPALVAWIVGLGVWSAALGGLGGEMADIVRANPELIAVLGLSRAEDVIVALALLMCGVGACAFAVQAASALGREESSGRLALLLSTRASRSRLWLAWLLVTAAGAMAVLLSSALVLGVATAWSTGDSQAIGRALAGGGALLVPVALVAALAGLLHGLGPRLTAAGWVVVGWAMLVGMLAETLRLPAWARDLSPLHAVGRVPIEDARMAALLVMAGLTVIALLAGLARFRHRSLAAG